MTAQEFIDGLNKIETLANAAAHTAAALAPEASAPLALVSATFPIVAELVSVALNAWSQANSQPITVDTIKALLPNQTPLTPPDAA